MSALDDIIAKDSGPQQASPLDAVIAKDAGASPQSAAPAQAVTILPQQGDQPGALTSFAAGLGHGFGSTVLGAQQLAGKGLTAMGSTNVGPWLSKDADQGLNKINAEYQPYQTANPISAGAGDIGGNIGATVPLAAAAPIGAGSSILAKVLGGVGVGAASGAVAPVQPGSDDYWSQKGAQTALGGAFGGAGAAGSSALSSALAGVGGPAQQALKQAGVAMTPGQILGGALAKTEDKMTSIPILGDFIKSGQQRAVQTFNRAAYDEALAPIGGSVPSTVPVGSDAVASVRAQIGNVYNQIEPRATFVADQNFANDVTGIRANLSQTAPATVPQFDNILNHQVTQKLDPQQVMTGAQWGDTRSEINSIARNQVLGNATPDNRSLAQALSGLNDSINAGVARSSPPDVLPQLQSANAAWARYKQIENAAGSVGASNNGNVFTAAQFANAVRKGSTAGQKATNSGLNGDLASSANEVLGAKYPDSGTPGRALLGALLGGSLALPASVSLPAYGAGALLSSAYTGPGQKLAQALLMSRPASTQVIGNAVKKFGTPVAPLLGAALANGGNQ